MPEHLTPAQAVACYQIGVALHLMESAFHQLPGGRRKCQLWNVRAGNAMTTYLSELANQFGESHHTDAASASAALAKTVELLMPLTPEERAEWLAECVTRFLEPAPAP